MFPTTVTKRGGGRDALGARPEGGAPGAVRFGSRVAALRNYPDRERNTSSIVTAQ